MNSTLKRHTLAAAALSLCATLAAPYDTGQPPLTWRRGKFKKINLHGSGKQHQNPPGTKPNRALRRMKGR